MKIGIINKLTVTNFVTYSYVEMYPGPNLNIVLGPNGTGKSSVVAAIILGLGGTPKIIGRGSKVSEYVKHGCTEAKIDVELEGKAAKPITITRTFNLSNHNKWYINNKNVSEDEVKVLTKSLNIQVSNLCQFLPQDRVQDFSKMNKKELLVNTQTAVGREDLVDKYNQLLEAKNEQKNFAKNMESITEKMANANANITRLTGKVQNLHEKQRIGKEIEIVKCKRAWEHYNDLLKRKDVADKMKRKAEEKLWDAKQRIKPAEDKITKLRTETKKLHDNLLEIRKQIKTLETTFQNLIEKNEDIAGKKKNIQIDMNSKLQALLEYQNEIDTMNLKIDKLSNDEKDLISKYGNVDDIIRKAAQLQEQSNEFNSQSEENNRKRIVTLNMVKKQDAQISKLEDALQQMENVKEIRLRILERRDPDAYNAVMWLRQNTALFSGKIYEPIMLELNVIEKAHAVYLENIIAMRDRVAFTCENRDDMNLFMIKVRDELGLRVNVVHSGPEHPSIPSFRPQIPIDQLRQYGFFAHALSLVNGPEPILKYLCRMYAIHDIPIGDKTTYSMADQLPPQLRLFFSEAHRFSVTVSRYSNEKSTRISGAESDGTLSTTIDQNQLTNKKNQLSHERELKGKLQVALETYASQTQIFEGKRTDALRERHDLLQSKEQIEIVRNRIIKSRQKLDEHVKKRKNEQDIRQEARHNLQSLARIQSVKLQKEIKYGFKQIHNELKKEQFANLKYNIKQQQITHIENDVTELREAYGDAARELKKVIVIHENVLAETEVAKTSAKKYSNGHTPKDKGFDPYREKFQQLPNDLETLDSLIDKHQTRLECLLTVDDDELKTYENAQTVLQQCEQQLRNKETTLAEVTTNIKLLYQEWIQPLQQLVDQINRKFSGYFESMGCAGEVAISHEAGVEEYSDYGLCIRVTYRAGAPLQELNRYVQSGGERTVATAVYMLSMQDLTVAPFRCVDEINQGMDPQNERRIFEILVNATTAAGHTDTSQYFLITPKLISGLQFGEDMKIHIIYNGPYCEVKY